MIQKEEIAVPNENVIEVENLSKFYKLYDKPADRLKECIHPFGKKYHREFYALRDISFTVKKGETIGILGQNGSGKSTLLKLITGVVTPSAGRVAVHGRIAALLELGAGFNPEFTGIQNIYMNGTILGYSQKEMDQKIDAILSFADIGEFVYQPVKMYSSGMFARLAFAVNANVNPDVLIVDEALSVGDMFFQAKCIDAMKRMIDDGVTILFVSHDTYAIKSLCQRGILLNKGNLLLDDKAEAVVEKYFSVKVAAEQRLVESSPGECLPADELPAELPACFGRNDVFLKNAAYQRIQNGKAEFYNIQLLDEAGAPVIQVVTGQKVKLRMAVVIHQDIAVAGFGYHIRSANGVDVVYTDTKIEDRPLFALKKGERYVVDWEFCVDLQAGNYNFACVMSIPIDLSAGRVDFCDFVPCALQFAVACLPDAPLYGYVHWENALQITRYGSKS